MLREIPTVWANHNGADLFSIVLLRGEKVLAMAQAFKVSTGLKDLIGRGLITDRFVAIFELVKNSFDAHAKTVQILFEDDRIVITDNGKGMSQPDILNKWLFVAYSAKHDGTEDDGYRDEIANGTVYMPVQRALADFLATSSGKSSCSAHVQKKQPVQILDIDWTLYERDAKEEFGKVMFNLSESRDFPDSACISRS